MYPILARSAANLMRRLATGIRALDHASQPTSKASCGFVPITDQTPKPACKTPSEMDALIRHRNALPLHSPVRGPLNRAIYLARHDILKTKGQTQ